MEKVTNGLDSRQSSSCPMPTQTRTKKAIQEIAKVFNKLASELTFDLNQAVKEIESLKREVHRLKTSQSRNAKSFPTTRRANTKRAPRTPKVPGTSGTTTSHLTTTHSTPLSPGHHETHGETTKPGHESSFVFPNEPFSSSPSPEPSSSSNN